MAAAVSLIVSLTPWAIPSIRSRFTTWVHGVVALMTVLVGGRVTSITISRTERLTRVRSRVSGAAASPPGTGRGGRDVVMAATRPEADLILLGLGGFMLFTRLDAQSRRWGRARVGEVCRPQARALSRSAILLSLLAIQVALDSVYDIRVC
jgi:hypothetical protein